MYQFIIDDKYHMHSNCKDITFFSNGNKLFHTLRIWRARNDSEIITYPQGYAVAVVKVGVEVRGGRRGGGDSGTVETFIVPVGDKVPRLEGVFQFEVELAIPQSHSEGQEPTLAVKARSAPLSLGAWGEALRVRHVVDNRLAEILPFDARQGRHIAELRPSRRTGTWR